MKDLIPLEDGAADIVGKALRGLKLTDSVAAAHAGISEAAVRALRDGAFDETAARAVAPVLGLGANALAAAGTGVWRPQPVEVAGLATFNTPFHDMTVNSYIAFDRASGAAVAFDTGADCSAMLTFLRQENLSLKLILLTHNHADHIADLARLQSETDANIFTGTREPAEGARPFDEGRTFDCGSLHIETRLTWGHCRGGITYFIHGLARPIAIVGDAVFAGSMGGGGISYADALDTNRTQILTLPDDTVICPGHGPLTTVGEEKIHNPFFAS